MGGLLLGRGRVIWRGRVRASSTSMRASPIPASAPDRPATVLLREGRRRGHDPGVGLAQSKVDVSHQKTRDLVAHQGASARVRSSTATARGPRSHLVFAQVFRVEAREPRGEPFRIRLCPARSRGSWRCRSRYPRRRSGRGREAPARGRRSAGVDGDELAPNAQVDSARRTSCLSGRTRRSFPGRLEILDDVPQEVVRHRPRRWDVFDLEAIAFASKIPTEIGRIRSPASS